ncbi:MAG: cation:proton antiporter [Candidatus Aenigmarchaeota archaeon]|nr:cation:proton antiporter [Candidatus Aenigmarchaeota archaeon]
MFILTFLLGKLLEKFRVPWIFSALLIGLLLSIYNPFKDVTSSDVFSFLANVGMYFLLFIVGLELDLKEIKKKGMFIVGGTFSIILFEALFGAITIHFLFHYSWFISVLVGLSFATVGEAILIPILDEFKLVNTNLGQMIIGIGTLDDAFEIFTLILVSLVIGSQVHETVHTLTVMVSLFFMFVLAFGFTKFKKEGEKFKFKSIETLFLFAMFVLFIFIGIGHYAESAALGALLAGVSLKTFLPKKRLKLIENDIRSVCYGLFAPIFFLWVGVSINAQYLSSFPLVVLIFFAVSAISKILASVIVGTKSLGFKKSFILGVGLTSRFSTSIVIIKILLDNGIVSLPLYSVIVASTALFTFFVPITFAKLISIWKVRR